MTRYIQAMFWDESAQTYLGEYPRQAEGLPYSTMWGLGIQFSALAGGTRRNPERCRFVRIELPGRGALARTRENERDPWWEVEVSSAGKIDRIRIWNRTDAVSEQLDDARVLILDTNRKPVWESGIEETPGPSIELEVRDRAR